MQTEVLVKIAILGLFTLVVTAWLFFRRSVAYTERQCFHPFHYEDQSVLSRDDAFIFAATDEPLPTGWQGWEGGDCPVPYNYKVVVMLRNGTIMRPCCAADLDWYHGERAKSNDIVAWRVA